MKPIHRPSIEYPLVEHCNLSCYGCDHASPLLKPIFADLEVFRADLRALGRHLSVEELYLIGGEPLLHPRLAEFVEEGLRSGIARGVTIVTNGTLLHTMPDRVWTTIAGLDVTLYPGVRLRMTVEEIAAACRARGVRLRVRSPSHFRTTVLNRRIEDRELVQRIFDACRITHDYGCHAVYKGRYYKCSVAPYMAQRLQRLGLPADDVQHDGVALVAGQAGREALARYLETDTPLASCAFCLGTCGKEVPHHQVNAAGRAAWLAEAHATPEQLIVHERLRRVRPVPGVWARAGRAVARLVDGLAGLRGRWRPPALPRATTNVPGE